MVVLIELTGRAPGIEPAILLPVVIVGAAMLAGLSGAAVAGAVGASYTVLYYSQPEWAGAAAGLTHSIAALAASAIGAWPMLVLRDRLDAARSSEA